MRRTKKNHLNFYLALLALTLLTSACSKKEQKQTQIDTCLNHYRAESYQVASQQCFIAAEQGSPMAQWLMAHLYRYDLLGKGENLETAFSWYLKAAKNGHLGAIREVGQAYIYADGTNQDYTKAHQWLRKAAKRGDSEAEFSMGILFFEGWGRKKDLGSAINWFKRAAAQEHSMSINNLAWLFATSENTAYNNPKKAKYWIEKLDHELLDDALFLDTKAAVMAAVNNFEQAIELQNQAITQLPEATPKEEQIAFQKHLDHYLQGKVWLE